MSSTCMCFSGTQCTCQSSCSTRERTCMRFQTSIPPRRWYLNKRERETETETERETEREKRERQRERQERNKKCETKIIGRRKKTIARRQTHPFQPCTRYSRCHHPRSPSRSCSSTSFLDISGRSPRCHRSQHRTCIWSILETMSSFPCRNYRT